MKLVSDTRADEALRDVEVSITGKLASMTRAEAVERIEAAGGAFIAVPRRSTRFLVVGGAGAPDGGAPPATRCVEAAVELGQRGVEIEFLAEEAFVALLEGQAKDASPLYTIGQLARILDVAPGTVRSWMRRGFISPARVVRRLAYFDFHEVANARALLRLLADGATPARVGAGLRQLHGWLPDEEAQLRLLELGDGEVLVRLADGRLAEPSGQLRLDFEHAADPDPSAEAERVPSITRRSQMEWFVEGVQAEEAGDLTRAADAYHEALLAGEQRAEVCFNLGNVLHSLRRRGEAAQRYMQAVELAPDYVEAWNNLGNTLAELGRNERALIAYHRALGVDPDYADAHFNLAATLEGMGRSEDAVSHWEAYLRQDPEGPDAEFVRKRLAAKSRR